MIRLTTHTSKKLLIIAAMVACTAAHAEQTRDKDGLMLLVYSGTAEESRRVYVANTLAAKEHADGRKGRMEKLKSKLAMF